jgi:mannose-6-phosphate isomerase-like protein (cupin superfamily)
MRLLRNSNTPADLQSIGPSSPDFSRHLSQKFHMNTSAPAVDQTKKKYLLTQLDTVPAVPCPCGLSRRGFAIPENKLATIHLVDISIDAQTHYHRQMTEIYLVLEGEGFIELDGERVPAKPMMSVFIKPGCRHRLVGRFRIVNVAIPAFDPQDEWFD